MHILFLTDNFPPEVNAPASRTFEHCREWVKSGHAVTVITCVPNFPKGEIFVGYKNKLWQQERMEGIRVVRVWSYIVANEGFGKRTLDYMSYMVTGTLASLGVNKVNVVVGTSPQLFTVCAAYVVSRLKRVPFVFELRDLWPESIQAVGAMKNEKWIDRLERLAGFLYRKAEAIVTVTHPYKDILSQRGVDPEKIKVVMNGIDISRFAPRPKDTKLQDRLGLEGKFVAGYIGTHGLAHALETVLAAARQLKERGEELDIVFVFLGDGAEKRGLQEKAKKMGLDNVTFIDSVPKKEVVRYWAILDLSIIHLKKSDLFRAVIPSKLFESMGMGIPVLHGVAGESANIVEKEGVGLLFEPENADELCDRLLQLKSEQALHTQMKANCMQAVKRYDRKVLADDMLQVLEKVASVEPQPALGPETRIR